MALEFRRIAAGMETPLADFLRSLEKSGDSKWFHPHPMTEEEAVKRCAYDGKDLYYVATNGGTVLAYGMLRGWDEGWKIPSLGIAVHPSARGTGLAKAFMRFLHAAARANWAETVRLKVFPENEPAVGLYGSLGYAFRKETEAGQLVGYFDLNAKHN